MKISMIAAIGKNMELGMDNGLIWNLPSDLKFFKKMTMGKSIIMGRKTFESLPKMLPKRKHIVLSSQNNFPSEVEVYKSIKDFLIKYQDIDDELFVIGGASIYESFMNLASKLYLTEIDETEKKADVYFPNFKKEDWDKNIIDCNSENGITYQHILYRRK